MILLCTVVSAAYRVIARSSMQGGRPARLGEGVINI